MKKRKDNGRPDPNKKKPVCLVLTESNIVFLDRLALDIRRKHGLNMKRSAVLRGLLSMAATDPRQAIQTIAQKGI